MEHLGISIGESIQVTYLGNYYDEEEHDFHDFPQKSGWDLQENGEFQHSRPQPEKFQKFMQSWLFFGLLSTVVYLGRGQKIIFSEFVRERQITTRPLTGYLNRWQDAEMEDIDGLTTRMIRAQAAMDKARQAVRKYCSLGVAAPDRPLAAKDTYRVDGAIALSLMVLGETLTAAKARIVERVGFNIRGWHGDAGEGWGTPEIIIRKMENSGWCDRTIHVLQGQLKHQATALLFAYCAHPDGAGDHGACTKKVCQKMARNATGDYEPQHVECDGTNCPSRGPLLARVHEAIREDKIPLLRFLGSGDDLQVDVVKVAPDDSHEYVTISHVWAHGYGNDDKNELRLCQLKYFKDLFEKLQEHGHEGKAIDFWIDTLAIPLEPDELRVRAIQQMYEIYTRAKYTIVIDNELRMMTRGTLFETTAMKVLASSWMRRLWTLQEAYLSSRVLFVMHEDEMMDLDDLEYQYSRANMRFTSDDLLKINMPNTARHYFHTMMGQERKERLIKVNRTRNMALVISVVRAAHWRTTTHPEHEVLALATLFNLVNRSTSFAKASIRSKDKTQGDIQQKLRELWILLEEVYPGSIPSGIIFMPGNKIDINGFRWAPRTFMVGQEADHPDPLTASLRPAELETNNGLLVRYPGFLLHVKNPRKVVLDPEPHDSEFSFATDSSLSEWYAIKSAQAQDSDVVRPMSTDSDGFAIILSCNKPMQSPEIGLLVEITRRSPRRELKAHGTPTTYHVLIVRRVYIRRDFRPADLHKVRREITSRAGFPDDMVFGEILDPDTKWFVGGEYKRRQETSVSQSSAHGSSNEPIRTRQMRISTFNMFGRNQGEVPPSEGNSRDEPRGSFLRRRATDLKQRITRQGPT